MFAVLVVVIAFCVVLRVLSDSVLFSLDSLCSLHSLHSFVVLMSLVLPEIVLYVNLVVAVLVVL